MIRGLDVSAQFDARIALRDHLVDFGERIARVRITTPDNFLISNGVRANEDIDFVIMDDFLYATPAAVPEPEVWAMILMGLGVVGWRSRRRA